MPRSVDPDFAARRRSTVAEKLTPETLRWLTELPVSARPQQLAAELPRIGNAISRLWSIPAACLAYLDELLIDKRGNRRGFPKEILLELATLKSHFQTDIHPTPRTAWEEISERSRERQH